MRPKTVHLDYTVGVNKARVCVFSPPIYSERQRIFLTAVRCREWKPTVSRVCKHIPPVDGRRGYSKGRLNPARDKKLRGQQDKNQPQKPQKPGGGKTEALSCWCDTHFIPKSVVLPIINGTTMNTHIHTHSVDVGLRSE